MLKSLKLKLEKQSAAAPKKNEQGLKEKANAREKGTKQMPNPPTPALAQGAADKNFSNPNTPSIADHDGSADAVQPANDKKVEVDLLKIPAHLRRQINE